jgi:small neutral amino acid transporter SnatA (MarC family)
MRERAAAIFPFAIAVVLPPAGVLIGISAMNTDRELGTRIIVVAALAMVVWAFLLLS